MRTTAFETLLIPVNDSGTDIAMRKFPGNGPEIVMLHGITGSSADFDMVLDEMTSFSQPITMDLRGHGLSSKPEKGYQLKHYVSDLEAVIQALGLQHPVVLGHSLGGLVVLRWAAAHPSRPRALIIEDSPLRSGRDLREAFDGWLLLNALPQQAASSWYESRNPDWQSDVLEQRSRDIVDTERAAIKELRKQALWKKVLISIDEFSPITSPLLFLQGNPEKGGMVQWEDLATLQHTLPQLELRLFRDSGHTIHRSQPQDWLTAVRTYIETLTR